MSDWQLDPRHSGAFLRLQKMLPRLTGFRVLLLQMNQPLYRDGLIAALDESLDSFTTQTLDVRELGGYEALEKRLLQAESNPGLLHIINLESLATEEQTTAFKGLNYHREQLAEACNCTLAFWLPEPLIKQIALQAADFWAWREEVFDFSVPTGQERVTQRWDSSWQKTTGLDKDKKQQRIKEIQEHLNGIQDATPTLSNADLMHELGNLLEETGEYDQARQVLSDALAAYRELDERHAYARVMMDRAYLHFRQGEPKLALDALEKKILPWFIQLSDIKYQAEAYSQIADIYQERGELDKALDIRKNEEMPVYEKLGDIREKAITMGKIADIFQARGELDKALDIRKNEEMPVYEKLGDIRLIAITKGYIADIYQAHGELDKALDIRKNEEMPVYEKLGDIRSQAITMGQIADIYQARGELDKALDIRKNEEMPVYEKLGDIRSLLVGRTETAQLLWQIDSKQNAQQVRELLCLALQDANRIKIPESEWIKNILRTYSLSCDDTPTQKRNRLLSWLKRTLRINTQGT